MHAYFKAHEQAILIFEPSRFYSHLQLYPDHELSRNENHVLEIDGSNYSFCIPHSIFSEIEKIHEELILKD